MSVVQTCCVVNMCADLLCHEHVSRVSVVQTCCVVNMFHVGLDFVQTCVMNMFHMCQDVCRLAVS